MLGDRKTVVLRGGAPWGFRLSGGGQTPVYIAKVRSRSKAALGGLAAGDTLVSINGISSLQQSLREMNDIIDTVRDQLIIEVHSSAQSRGHRLDSGSSIDTRENSPVRTIHRIAPVPKQMDYHSSMSSRTTPTLSSYAPSPASAHYLDGHASQREQRYTDSYGRSIPNPTPMFRAATITSNSPPSPIATARVQHSSYRPPAYEPVRQYHAPIANGYVSDTNDFRQTSASVRSTNGIVSNNRPMSTAAYNVKISTSNEPNYYSDSEYVTSGPRYYKISRQINNLRRPSNVVLPIRSMTSKAYEPYVPPEPLPQQQQQPPPPFDPYRYQQPAPIRIATSSVPSYDYGSHSHATFNHELGADLYQPPLVTKKRFADSSFFRTAHNTYPTIDDQKTMARTIASILEGGDSTQRGATKFERQRQRADQYAIENDALQQQLKKNNYRPLRPLQTYPPPPPPAQFNYHQSDVPNCIKHSLDESQYVNPLRYVGAPEEFKQMHMQEHVTHNHLPPQAAMSLVDDLNSSRGKGAALFQKRKARSEKWVIDENNVKKQGYQPIINHNGAATGRVWGQRAPPPTWSDNEESSYSPIRPTFNPSPISIFPEPVLSPNSNPMNAPRFGDFNAKPKGFGAWNADNGRSQSPRGHADARKPLNLNIEPSIREGIAESHTRPASQPWSPPFNPSNHHFNYPPEPLLPKWNQHPSSMPPMTHEGIDYPRQRMSNTFNPSSAARNFTDL